MNVQLKDGVLTIKTGVLANQLKRFGGYAVLKDEKGNGVYGISLGESANLTGTSITCNQVVDGEAAYIVVVEAGTTQEDIVKVMGKDILAASKNLPQIVANMTAEERELDSIFSTEGPF